ncbi:MAG: hypothetical protein AAB434_04510 [Planctomycetota bacterium]
MHRGFRASLAAALVVAGLVGLMGSTAQAEKAAPMTVTVGVKGLDKDSGKALETALKALESVTDAKADDKGVLVQVKSEKTLQLSDVLAAVQAQSTEEKKLEADKAGVALVGTVSVAVGGATDDAAVIEALKSAPNVEKVEGSAGTFSVTFKGAKGATVGDLETALKTKVGAAEGATPPSVDDVAWTAPKGDDGGKHG